jgi:predicted nucleotidyltransferase
MEKNRESIVQSAIKTIEEAIGSKGLKVKKIMLFGSRARGNPREDSDWDFFVIVDKKLGFNEKWDIIDEIKIKLAKLKIPNDIILKSEGEVEESKDDIGRITYYALKEGIEL